MAYVVARRGGRFEIRESLYTANGPRSRTLAGFDVLTDDLITAAAQRAQRPFDGPSVIRSARRAGARVRATTSEAISAHNRFVTASKRMSVALEQPPESAGADPGMALQELLGFADMVVAGQPPRPFEPLIFPVLAGLAKCLSGVAIAQRQ